MKPTARKPLLFGLLAVSAALVAWDRLRAPQTPAISGAVQRTAPAAPAAGATAAAEANPATFNTLLEPLRPRDDYQRPGLDAFPANVARVPELSQASPPVAEPARPSAPALPFTVIGKKFERGQWEVYLARGDQTYIATVGLQLSDDYRVAAITPTQMTLVYLPLNESQTLQIGASFQ